MVFLIKVTPMNFIEAGYFGLLLTIGAEFWDAIAWSYNLPDWLRDRNGGDGLDIITGFFAVHAAMLLSMLI